jgi:hypothetical protein
MASFFPMLAAVGRAPEVAAVHFDLTAEDLALQVQVQVQVQVREEQRGLCSVPQEMKVREEPAVLR